MKLQMKLEITEDTENSNPKDFLEIIDWGSDQVAVKITDSDRELRVYKSDLLKVLELIK